MEKILTVVILTKDEEENIVDCITNAKQVTEEVLVIDSGSEDATVELAKSVGARVVYRAWDDDFSAQRNFAIENSDAEWILYLDADERLSDELIKSIKQAVQDNRDVCYEIKRMNCALGYPFKHGVYGPDKVTRMFKRTHFKYVNKIHEHAECTDPCRKLKGVIEHYTTRTWEEIEKKTEQYTTIWAQNAYEHGKRTNIAAAWLHAVVSFIKVYFLQLGFLDGRLGWVFSCNHFVYTMMKYERLYELEKSGGKL